MRQYLTQDTTLYVSSTGSDSNDGLTPQTAWLTPQYAIDRSQRDYDLGGRILTIQFADSLYYPGFVVYGGWVGSRGPQYVKLQGNPANPTAVPFGNSNNPAIQFWVEANCLLDGVKVIATGPNGFGVDVADSYVYLGAIDYGRCDQGCLHTAGSRGRTQAFRNQVISGPSPLQALCVEDGSHMIHNHVQLQVAYSQNMSIAFINVDNKAYIDLTGTSFPLLPGVTVTGRTHAVTSQAGMWASNLAGPIPGNLPPLIQDGLVW